MRVLLALALVACATAAPPARIDLAAERRYAVPAEPGLLVVDAAVFARFARDLRAGVEGELARHDLRDPAALRERLFTLALLDALDDRWDAALADIDRIVPLAATENDRIMTGLTIRVWHDARAHGGDFRAALERKLATMPVAKVRGELEMLQAMGQQFSPETCRRLIDEAFGEEAKRGSLPLAPAQAVAFQRYAVVNLVPVGKDIDEVVGKVLAAAGE
jgi:hypothetical protein